MSVINHGPPALQTEQNAGEAHLNTVNENEVSDKVCLSGSVRHLTRENSAQNYYPLFFITVCFPIKLFFFLPEL